MTECDIDKNIFEILIDNAINERLDEILLQDKEYQEIQDKINNLSEQLYKLELPDDQLLIVDRLISSYTEIGCYYGKITYQQGFKDCALLLREMELIN